MAARLPKSTFVSHKSCVRNFTASLRPHCITPRQLTLVHRDRFVGEALPEASFGWVDLDHNFKLTLATGQLVLPVGAMRLAVLDNSWLWVFACFEHLLDVVWLLGQ